MTESTRVRLPGVDHPIVLSNGQVVVLLGPNGSGKTRIGAALARQHGATWINAQRMNRVRPNLHIPVPAQAERELADNRNRRLEQVWSYHESLAPVMNALLVDDYRVAHRVKDAVNSNSAIESSHSTLDEVLRLWHEVIPNRLISISCGNELEVENVLSRETYSAEHMSDGERAALGLIATVLHSSEGLVVVDEPEIHLQRSTAKVLWRALCNARRGCAAFVFVTHDVEFALAMSPDFVGVCSSGNVSLLEGLSEVPSSVVQAITGSGVLSVSARRIVLCEGVPGGIDQQVYSAWFSTCEATSVVAAGSGCESVAKAAEVLRKSSLVTGARVIGIVDRDYRAADEVENMQRRGLSVLGVHEVESLLCLEPVFEAVASRLEVGEADVSYRDFLKEAHRNFGFESVNRELLRRVKHVARRLFPAAIGKCNASLPQGELIVEIRKCLPAVEGELVNAWNEACGQAGAFDDIGEARFLETVLQFLPGKYLLGRASKALGVGLDRYIALACKCIESAEVGSCLERSLLSHLPDRSIDEATMESP